MELEADLGLDLRRELPRFLVPHSSVASQLGCATSGLRGITRRCVKDEERAVDCKEGLARVAN